MKAPLFPSLLALAAVAEASHVGLHHTHRRRHHGIRHDQSARTSVLERGLEPMVSAALYKRNGKCQFPSDVGLVAVTPDAKNAGWALGPDQSCEPDSYCPYACPPGQLMAQWDPKATAYIPEQSQRGGLYCDKSGNVSKPFSDKPYCVDGTGSVGCKNKANGNVAFCQTVLPGNEAMLIPTNIKDSGKLAVPDPNYWASTAAHYYVNPPGISPENACVWGTKDKPVGNWSPYVAGANADDKGQTFLKLGWNPVYLEPATPFRDKMPSWGLKIECDGDGCNGLPCAIDPSKHSVNQCSGGDTVGAGGATFCVVTVPKGIKANIVVFESSGGGVGLSSNSGGSSSSSSSSSSSTPLPPPSSSPSSGLQPTTMSMTSSTSSTSSRTSSSSSTSSTPSSSASTTLASTTSTTSSSVTSTTATSEMTPSSTITTTSPSTTTTTGTTTTTSASLSESRTNNSAKKPQKFKYSPHVFVENSTATQTTSSISSTTANISLILSVTTPQATPSKTSSKTNSASLDKTVPATAISLLMLLGVLAFFL